MRGDFAAAADAARRSVAAQPERGISYRPALVVALAHAGRLDEARVVLEQVLGQSPGFHLGATRLIVPPAFAEVLEAGFARLGVEVG